MLHLTQAPRVAAGYRYREYAFMVETMASGVYVEVPEHFADALITDGFRKAGVRHGVDPLSALSAGANLVSIFVARHEIARFVAHLWARARGRPDGREHDSMVVFEHRGQRVAISLDHEGFGNDGPPPEVVRGMTALLEAMAEFDRDRPGAIPGSGP